MIVHIVWNKEFQRGNFILKDTERIERPLTSFTVVNTIADEYRPVMYSQIKG